jgi:hypothetical protein
MHRSPPLLPVVLRAFITPIVFGLAPSLSSAQSGVVKTPLAVMSTPTGKAIGSVRPGVELRVLETKGAYARVSVGGYVERTRLTSQRSSATTRVGNRSVIVRSKGNASAKSVASLDAGTAVDIETSSAPKGWVRVTRIGWVLRSALERPATTASSKPTTTKRTVVSSKTAATPSRKSSGGEVAPPTPSAPKATAPRAKSSAGARVTAGSSSTAPANVSAPVPAAAVESTAGAARVSSDSMLVPTANVALRSAPDARALATLTPGANLVPLARERGWVRVRLEGWVPEKDVAPADTTIRTGVSAADLRSDPQGSRGKVVRWSVQILATQKADALRRDLNPDETYLLARGPYEENALLYLVVPPSLMSGVKSIPELSQAMITARVRTGRSELVGVPILDILTITPKK